MNDCGYIQNTPAAWNISKVMRHVSVITMAIPGATLDGRTSSLRVRCDFPQGARIPYRPNIVPFVFDLASVDYAPCPD